MADQQLKIDVLPSLAPEDQKKIFSAETMSALLAAIKPHLEAEKRKLVYILPASGRIGHVVGEIFALWSLYHRHYDEILVVVRDQAVLPIAEGPRRLVERYVTFVETTNHLVVLMGHFTVPMKQFGVFDLLLTSAPQLCHTFFPTLSADGFAERFELPDDMGAQGETMLADLGWREGEPIVALHVREETFLASHRYHFYRAADIANYRAAIDRIVERGGWVFRLGDARSVTLDHPSATVVDLPHRAGYADWMDLFVISRARYSINCSSGPVSYCHPLGTPTLLVNNYAQAFCLLAPSERDLLLFKRYREEASGRYLPYAEILERGMADFSETRHFEEAGIILEQNTPEEILEAVVEMEARLDGAFVSDTDAQGRFRAVGLAHDRARMARVETRTASPAEYESPH